MDVPEVSAKVADPDQALVDVPYLRSLLELLILSRLWWMIFSISKVLCSSSEYSLLFSFTNTGQAY